MDNTSTNNDPHSTYWFSLRQGSGRDIYLMESPPRRGAGALMKDKSHKTKESKSKSYSQALFTESIFPETPFRSQSSYTARDRNKQKRNYQNDYMSTLSTNKYDTIQKHKNKPRPSTASAGSNRRNNHGTRVRKKREKQRQKFVDATTGRFKGAYFGGLKYAGGVSHGKSWS